MTRLVLLLVVLVGCADAGATQDVGEYESPDGVPVLGKRALMFSVDNPVDGVDVYQFHSSDGWQCFLAVGTRAEFEFVRGEWRLKGSTNSPSVALTCRS